MSNAEEKADRSSTELPGLDIRCPKCGAEIGDDCTQGGRSYAPSVHVQRLARSPAQAAWLRSEDWWGGR